MPNQHERLGIVALQRGGELIAQARPLIDQTAARLEQHLQPAHRGRHRRQWPQPVAMHPHQLTQQGGIERVVLGSARRLGCFAILGQHGRVDRKQLQVGVHAQRVHQGPFGLLQSDGDLPLWKTRAQFVGPRMQRERIVGEFALLVPRALGSAQADLMGTVGPIEADEGGIGSGRIHRGYGHDGVPAGEGLIGNPLDLEASADSLSWAAVSSRPKVSGHTSSVGLSTVVAGRGVSAHGAWDKNSVRAIAGSGELLTNPARCAAFRLQAAVELPAPRHARGPLPVERASRLLRQSLYGVLVHERERCSLPSHADSHRRVFAQTGR